MATIGRELLLEPLVMPGPCRSLLERWRSVVRSLPDRPAIHSPGVGYTFAESDALSDSIAADLLERLPDDGFPVALYADHHADALLGLLAIMKTSSYSWTRMCRPTGYDRSANLRAARRALSTPKMPQPQTISARD